MLLLLTFLCSLLMVSLSIPSIINLAFRKRLFDAPAEQRKIHTRTIPNFGGIAIFTGFLFSCSLFIPSSLLPEANRLMAGGLILFMVGLNDDIVSLGPKLKFLVQSCSAFIIAYVADIRIDHMQGFLGFGELDYVASILFTMLVIVGMVNAFNLIDGIDGLAASLGIILSLVYAYLFWNAGHIGWSSLSLSLTGALVGFLIFNVTPARIFMGDSGSLLLGFVAIVLSIKFIQVSGAQDVFIGGVQLRSGLSLVFAVLIIPAFDTIRVFLLRILNNKSPFEADNTHLHHRLLAIGFSHMQSTLILSLVNVLFVVMVISLQDLTTTQIIGILLFSILTGNALLSIYINFYKRRLASRLSVQRTAAEKKSFADEVLEHINDN